MTIRKPKGWGSIKPSVGFGVDWSDPINKNARGVWLFNEGAGTSVYDITGNGNTGTFGTGVTWDKSTFGKVASFPGTNADTNLITVANSNSVNIVGAVTMAAWVYPKSSGTYMAMIDRTSSGGGSRQYSMYLSTEGPGFIFLAFGGTNIGAIGVTPNWVVNQLNHIVVTADGTNAKIYVHGVLAATTSSALLPTSQTFPLYMGREAGNNFSLNGYMDQARIWARALNATEVARLYAEPFAGILRPKRRLWNGAPATVTEPFEDAWGEVQYGKRAWGIPAMVAGGVNAGGLFRHSDLGGTSMFGPKQFNPNLDGL